jgi:type I restriction enzyme S subunit
LSLYLSRKEFDRYARFNSWGSAREVFTMDDMNDVRIPIPDISVQKEIVNIHKCYIERQRIAAQLKEQLNNLCPILIKGSLETSN